MNETASLNRDIFCKLSVMQSISQMIFKLVSAKVALKDEGFEVVTFDSP
jgi:hypothetical protein